MAVTQPCDSRSRGEREGRRTHAAHALVVVLAICLSLPAARTRAQDRVPPRVDPAADATEDSFEDVTADRRVDPEALPPAITGAYRINVSDRLDVEFLGVEQLDRNVTVGPDGTIVLPLVGRIGLAGRTVDEAKRLLTDLFAEELVDPRITVAVSQFSGMLVYVGGEVNAPGMRPYRGGLTLLQAIIDAGGFSKTARQREVVLIRRAHDRSPVGTVVNVKRLLASARFDHDLALAPADVVYVPRKRIAKINLFVEQFLTNNLPFSLYLGYALPNDED